jgi:hypothetical protein
MVPVPVLYQQLADVFKQENGCCYEQVTQHYFEQIRQRHRLLLLQSRFATYIGAPTDAAAAAIGATHRSENSMSYSSY